MTKNGKKIDQSFRAVVGAAAEHHARSENRREFLIAYLKYAVDDVANVNERSALFLRMAIDDLEGRAQSAQQSLSQ
jgi:hypothetical protein